MKSIFIKHANTKLWQDLYSPVAPPVVQPITSKHQVQKVTTDRRHIISCKRRIREKKTQSV